MPRGRNEQQTFEKLRREIDRRFPPGHLVAIERGSLIADAPTFRELHALLDNMGKTSREILVVEAGVDLPDMTHILLSRTR